MQTKNLTPFLFGAKITSLKPPQLQMTMIVRASFTLRPNEPLKPIEDMVEQGPMTAEVFRDDDDDRVGECLYASDFAEFKLHAEVLLAGSCHTPGGRPMPECPVRFSVGSWSKALLVVGRRVWTEKIFGPAISEPHPFTTMPLGYVSSFGGPGYARNPIGKGHGTAELPNVESAAARVYAKGDRPEPAGFGPLSSAWPQRAGKVGTQYGAKWKKERAPFYAEDFDWTFFSAAPSDQQLPGYLRGDEDISFLNLHPATSHFSVQLPGLRIRAFAKDAEGMVREARMNLDTLFADLDNEKLVLTWRGLTPVTQDDLADVRWVLVASEKLTDPELPFAHYVEILAAFEADPLEIDKHRPGGTKALAAMKAAEKDEDEHPERTPAERMQAFLQNKDLFAIVPEEHRARTEEALAKTMETLAKAPSAPTAASPRSAGTALGAVVAKMGDAVKSLRVVAQQQGGSLDDVDQLEKMLDDPQMKMAIAALTPVSLEEIRPGGNLSGRNMMRMDLSGRDLSGANLEGANLAEANLAGARLAGANLKQAILAKTNLEGADLSDADLTKAMLPYAKASGANLERATLDQTILYKADLRRANLSAAKAQMVVFSESDLTEANFTGCDFFKAFGDKCTLERANFSGAKLVNSAFIHGNARGVNLTKAVLSTTSFADSDLRGACVVEARGEGTNWMRAVLEEADFRCAVLPSAHFMEAKATGARFSGADLRGSEFLRACLDRADFVKANLFEASLNKAVVNGTTFVDANLYQSRFLGASGRGCDFNGANLKRAILPS